MVYKHFHMNKTLVFFSIRFACVIVVGHLLLYELLIMGYSLFSDRSNRVC